MLIRNQHNQLVHSWNDPIGYSYSQKWHLYDQHTQQILSSTRIRYARDFFHIIAIAIRSGCSSSTTPFPVCARKTSKPKNIHFSTVRHGSELSVGLNKSLWRSENCVRKHIKHTYDPRREQEMAEWVRAQCVTQFWHISHNFVQHTFNPTRRSWSAPGRQPAIRVSQFRARRQSIAIRSPVRCLLDGSVRSASAKCQHMKVAHDVCDVCDDTGRRKRQRMHSKNAQLPSKSWRRWR